MRLEINETNKPGTYACPISMIDTVKSNHCKIIKVGRKWLYFKCTAKTRPDKFDMIMPFSLLWSLSI